MKYVVCKGKTVEHGIVKKVGNENTIQTKVFKAGSLIDLKDEDEHKRLLGLGVIRPLEEVTADAEDDKAE
ncbi:MAG: hypothetical protein GAK29_00883 [Acinetobacter bereziniae]|uniref:Uncharacterized protein n=1 Tax=Acinetobacter bereziniae TaxID=106648 RepID=A0A833PJQ8_ACIBZ|nr:MAG: hypothetical protein GAK29_00883 [Acinetobacter bereziniae]